MTRKIYDENSECFEFESEVAASGLTENGEVWIELCATAFFPEAGGQSADRGMLYFDVPDAIASQSTNPSRDDANRTSGSGQATTPAFCVKDVRIYEDGRIVHICEIVSTDGADLTGREDLSDMAASAQLSTASDALSAPILRGSSDTSGLSGMSDFPENAASLPRPGQIMHGRIDSVRRLEFMRHHTAEHIFSGLAHRHFGCANVGFHLSDHICTMDYDRPLSDEEVAMLEMETNAWIQKNVPVKAWYPANEARFSGLSEEEALCGYDYRCKGELTPPIRLVQIGAEEIVDICACCAPHVRSTGEIGLMKALEAKPYKGGVRLVIVAGMKAFKELKNRSDLLTGAAAFLSIHYEDLPARIAELSAERSKLRRELAALGQQLLEARAASIPDSEENALLFANEADMKAARETVNTQTQKRPGLCGVFIGADDAGYQFVLGSATFDMKKTASLLRDALQAKCGGSKTMISGKTVAKREEIARCLGVNI